ncbi:MAG: c-type cytochrome [Pirellulaceae bacterium]|nr:c-type cytochrome [Pirellulaceae bacterium]
MRSIKFLYGLLLATVVITCQAHAAGLGVTAPEQFSLLPGFEVELLYEVPGEQQGSWVSLTVDPKGRLIACDQDGGLYRIDVSGKKAKVEKLKIDFIGAQGLLCAFDSLYANVNSRDHGCGIWRLTDTDGDDQYDKKENVVPLNGGSEHGPHAMILSPDGKRILSVAGNNTDLPGKISRSRVPQVWQEDHLLGRMPDARGHNAKRMAPGGFIMSMNPDGSDVELIATGFRNPYDIALNRDNELFTYDADMEWDVGTPWYRPTRINHVISGADFGWRNGTGKWPHYYPDSFGASVDIGAGSPTGIVFGYETKFPKKYQDALFICDWSYGNIHAVHLTADGSSYSGTYETFATAAPLPVTDLAVHPGDGALYVTIGGRQTQSGLYRIVYTGKGVDAAGPAANVDASVTPPAAAQRLRGLRQRLESSHIGETNAESLELAMKHLSHSDAAIRHAARTSLEHHPVNFWRDQVLQTSDARSRILGVIALARHGKPADQKAALDALAEIDFAKLSNGVRIDLLRAYGLVAIRLGEISGDDAQQIESKLAKQFPTGNNEVDRELAQVLVYLGSAKSVAKIVAEMASSPSQENQIHYAMTLRNMQEGWTPELHKKYFQWFNDIQSARGGMSFGGFIDNIKNAALERVPQDVQKSLASVIHPPKVEVAIESKPRPVVKQWTVEDLTAAVTNPDHVADFERGKKVFAQAQCYKCHRMGLQGGILGPDLTGAGGRFSPKDLLVSIIEPNKVISDQYGATQFLTDDGKAVIGRIVNMRGNELKVMTNMLDPSSLAIVMRDEIEATQPAKNSMMPSGLLDSFNQDEIADLVAYLRAGGRKSHPIYKATVAAK